MFPEADLNKTADETAILTSKKKRAKQVDADAYIMLGETKLEKSRTLKQYRSCLSNILQV